MYIIIIYNLYIHTRNIYTCYNIKQCLWQDVFQKVKMKMVYLKAWINLMISRKLCTAFETPPLHTPTPSTPAPQTHTPRSLTICSYWYKTVLTALNRSSSSDTHTGPLAGNMRPLISSFRLMTCNRPLRLKLNPVHQNRVSHNDTIEVDKTLFFYEQELDLSSKITNSLLLYIYNHADIF